jgi:hypothetical protein
MKQKITSKRRITCQFPKIQAFIQRYSQKERKMRKVRSTFGLWPAINKIITPSTINNLIVKDKVFLVPGHQKIPETSKKTTILTEKIAHAIHPW